MTVLPRQPSLLRLGTDDAVQVAYAILDDRRDQQRVGAGSVRCLAREPGGAGGTGHRVGFAGFPFSASAPSATVSWWMAARRCAGKVGSTPIPPTVLRSRLSTAFASRLRCATRSSAARIRRAQAPPPRREETHDLRSSEPRADEPTELLVDVLACAEHPPLVDERGDRRRARPDAPMPREVRRTPPARPRGAAAAAPRGTAARRSPPPPRHQPAPRSAAATRRRIAAERSPELPRPRSG